MVVLEGADHVKYGMGSVGRMKRMAPSFQVVAADLTKALCQLTKALTNQTSPN